MELIAALEGTAREVYTGAVGIASPVSGLELNVAIRTFEMAAGKVWLGVGGGVVADSDPDRELEECFDKARPLLSAVGAQLDLALGPPEGESNRDAPGEWGSRPDVCSGVFETMLVADGRPIELESHLGRLAESVSGLFGARPPARLGAEVTEIAASRPEPQRLRVRVRPSPDGSLTTELSVSPAPEAFAGHPSSPAFLVPVVLPSGLGRHKWHDRRMLADRHMALELGSHEQLLLVDADGSVLETERANVLALFGSLLITPPADGRILAGTTRETALRAAALIGLDVSVQALSLVELGSADEVFLTSSIKGLTPVIEIRGQKRWTIGRVSERLAEMIWELWRRQAGPSQVVGGYPLAPRRLPTEERLMAETVGTGPVGTGE
jgi:para-aminobenzoate synthetase/4-amino-4-deoxychorismate lyase